MVSKFLFEHKQVSYHIHMGREDHDFQPACGWDALKKFSEHALEINRPVMVNVAIVKKQVMDAICAIGYERIANTVEVVPLFSEWRGLKQQD